HRQPGKSKGISPKSPPLCQKPKQEAHRYVEFTRCIQCKGFPAGGGEPLFQARHCSGKISPRLGMDGDHHWEHFLYREEKKDQRAVVIASYECSNANHEVLAVQGFVEGQS